MTDRPTKFLRESQDEFKVGAKVRCINPGRYEVLKENDVYTISWLDWPFVLEFEEIGGSWDRHRFVPYTGEIER